MPESIQSTWHNDHCDFGAVPEVTWWTRRGGCGVWAAELAFLLHGTWAAKLTPVCIPLIDIHKSGLQRVPKTVRAVCLAYGECSEGAQW